MENRRRTQEQEISTTDRPCLAATCWEQTGLFTGDAVTQLDGSLLDRFGLGSLNELIHSALSSIYVSLFVTVTTKDTKVEKTTLYFCRDVRKGDGCSGRLMLS